MSVCVAAGWLGSRLGTAPGALRRVARELGPGNFAAEEARAGGIKGRESGNVAGATCDIAMHFREL